MSQLALDILIVVILVGAIIWGARRGLLRSLANLIMMLLAMAASFLLVRPGSSWLLQQGLFNDKTQDLAVKLESLTSQSDGFITDVLEKLHLPEVWMRHITNRAVAERQGLVDNIASALTRLAVAVLVFLFLFTVVNVILRVVSRRLTRLLDNIFLVGFLNRAGGAIINLAFGLVVVILSLLLLSALTPWFPALGVWQKGSYIANFLREKNYFLSLLETIF
ncbi:MAG TPA: hypothetical protein GXX72_03040 [Clostridiaceae bacterium]|nr:hypothetical protein [Clostridiaceae bacterium]